LAQHVATKSSLRLDGLFFYPGHVWLPAAEQPAELGRIDALLAETIDLWKRSGFAAEIVSGGSTPTAFQSHHVRSQTEIRPGTYIYNDMNTARAGFCAIEDCAATIVCTVVSARVPGKVVIDAGTKTLTSDRNVKFPDSGHGHVVEHPDAVIVRLSEEHGELDVGKCDRTPKVGERVTVIPNHICPCVNLQNAVWLRKGGDLTSMTVDARGLLV
jgi:D-serine deaminase-like pyridoxal phosphate-dependent protein